MPVTRALSSCARPTAARWLPLLLAAALIGCGGGKKHAPVSVGTGQDDDAGEEIDAGKKKDAGSGPSIVDASRPNEMMDAQIDAGNHTTDAGVSHDAGSGTMPVDMMDDADAGPSCTNRGCRAMADDCHVGRCDTTLGECVFDAKPDGSACGSQMLDNCTAKDTCSVGTCMPNDQPSGTPCGDYQKDCHNDDSCDGSGHCIDNGLWAAGHACGDQTTNTACDQPDTCDENGVCQPNYASATTACTIPNMSCQSIDYCNEQGQCISSCP